MKKKISFFIIIIVLIVNIYNKNDDIDDLIENYDLKYEEYLKNFIKNYLKENDLLENERLIGPGEMKKIFIDIMMEGISIDDVDEYTKEMNEELARIFIPKYYSKKKEIRGKDIYDLIDINEIKQKYYQLNGEIPFIEDDDNDNIYNNDL